MGLKVRDSAELAALVERLYADLKKLEAFVPKKSLSAARIESIKRAQAARRMYSPEQKQEWIALAAELQGLSKRRKGQLIAKRAGLPDAAAGTIRRAL